MNVKLVSKLIVYSVALLRAYMKPRAKSGDAARK